MMDSPAASLVSALADFDSLRRRLELSVVAGATSVDGRTFTYQAPIGSQVVSPGGFVSLVAGDRRALGQVLDQVLAVRQGPATAATIDEAGLGGADRLELTSHVRLRVIEGTGRILHGDGLPLVDAAIESSAADEVEAFFTEANVDAARLPVGDLALVHDPVTANLDASGFDRHTFLCGQSGSGKTYSLGVVLERLLLDTDLRIIVIDPNSDFVHLDTPRAGADPALAARLADLAPRIRVRRPSADPTERRLRLRFDELTEAAWGALLRLDPIKDADDYAALREALDGNQGMAAMARLEADADDETTGGQARSLIRRVGNLGSDRWDIWAKGQAGSILEELDDDDWRALIIDVGTLGNPEEKSLVAQAVLAHLWARRNDRRPVLIVIDEAHNICPQLPDSALQAMATDYAVRIAAEGRKFGLYLLISTQRPQKVHENVVSQCDNLMLMRMNSLADVASLSGLFSFVPPALLEQATGFRQGQALVAGKVVPIPTLVRFGARVSVEGGSDVATDWARSR
jgi:DNA helicase HerA-like ATPase